MAGLLSLAAMNSVAQAGLYAPPTEATPAPVVSSFADHLYVGVFGGGGWLSATDNNQSGTAFYTTPALVDANGVSDTTDVGLVGLNVGYKWSDIALKQDSAWSLTPAVELEGYYLKLVFLRNIAFYTLHLLIMFLAQQNMLHMFQRRIGMSAMIQCTTTC